MRWPAAGGAAALPERVFALDYAPYAWLFPRMAGIVHHGGSGTTGLALGAGVPSWVVPFTADQPFWGWRTHDLGVGPAALPFKRLTADRLAQAIDAMTGDAALRQNALCLRDALAGEDGIAQAVGVIRVLLPTP